MAENTFNDPRILTNPYQDPMGVDAQQGLERFLDKFHQPGVPSHTIITDPEYFVFLWFHNAVGNLIDCPYTSGSYTPSLNGVPGGSSFDQVNKSFQDGQGIQGNGTDTTLPPKCFDLTPFVREATLPDIKPADGQKVATLFGETQLGSFSPYASDGQQQISLQVLDTEYSILDAIFYPWMKDVNSPWWYKESDVYTAWATPYPIATLEIQRPRMRFTKSAPTAGESRLDTKDYSYYSYKFLGVKPVSYTSFQVNAAGPTNLLRNVNFIADMCVVDLNKDTKTTTADSVNLGNRTSFLFTKSEDSDNPDNEEDPDGLDDDLQKAIDDLNKNKQDQDDNDKDVGQQEDGDQPGEDEPEDPEGNPDAPYSDNPQGSDENPGDNPGQSANEAQDDEDRDKEKEEKPEEKGFFGKIADGLKNVGNKIVDGAKKAAGAVANGIDNALGLEPGTTKNAVGAAVDVAKDVGKKAAEVAKGVAKTAAAVMNPVGAAATLAASVAVNAAKSAMGSSDKKDSEPKSKSLGNESKQASQAKTASSTAFGVVKPGSTKSAASSGGVLNKGVSAAAPSVANKVNNASDKQAKTSFVTTYGGTRVYRNSKLMKMVKRDEPQVDIQFNGAMKQMIDAQNELYESNRIVDELNSAAFEIADKMDDVGLVVDELRNIETKSVGELKDVVNRMVSGHGNKPSPLSHYAQMVEAGAKR